MRPRRSSSPFSVIFGNSRVTFFGGVSTSIDIFLSVKSVRRGVGRSRQCGELALTQHFAVDLARGSFWQLGDESDLARILVRGEPCSHQLLYFFDKRVVAVARCDDKRLDDL